MASPAPLMVSISGVRGIVGESLSPEVIVRYVRAFCGLFAGTSVIVGRDSRVSGPWIVELVCAVLRSCGKNVTEIGIVATPTVQLAVLREKADGGGIVVTSSHNPIEWNGLKFIAPDSLFCGPEQCASLYAADASCRLAAATAGGSLVRVDDWSTRHVQAVLACPAVAARLVLLREKALPVALDTVRGAGGEVMHELLTALGCRITRHLYKEPTGLFPRPPEPIPAHLGELGDAVRESQAAIGIAVDPDVDRCVLLDETGKPIGEEYTLCAAVHYLVATLGRRGPVVRNLSSSRASDDVARAHDCPVIATAVGEVHVARAMLADPSCVVGGEGNGGVLLPELHLGRDAPVAAALALCFLVSSSQSSSSAAFAELPQYHIAKLKAPMVPHFDRCVEVVAKEAGDEAQINKSDGVRIDEPKGWVHLRKSNTEPVYRVIGEYGSTLESSTEYCQRVMNRVAELSAKFVAEENK